MSTNNAKPGTLKKILAHARLMKMAGAPEKAIAAAIERKCKAARV